MADRFDILAQAILKKSFSACSEEELYELTNQYPYFAPAHFLYLRKLDPQCDAYRKQFQKAVLYFPNPAGFQHFIQNPQFDQLVNDVQIIQADLTNAEQPTEDLAIADETLTIILPQQENEVLPTLELTFEPFHTVDYFASQGIKLSQEEQPKDKLGKQLKSFTEWLKTMKKLPSHEIGSVNGKEERHVEHMAAYSVKTADIITESMAEVWLRQGNKPKAIEVYRKLSLLNPSKSAYFAAKIDNLNASN